MLRSILTRSAWIAALVAGALVGATVAFGAASGTKTATTGTTTTAQPARTQEAPLTGDALAKAKAAAVAKVGGTADSATTETDGSNAAAAYEVHVTKADGSRVTVILDAGFGVLSVETAPQHVRGGGPGNGETPLTGDALAQAKAAALAKVGGTVEAATTETDGSNAAAAYEVHVTKADGSRVEVILDKSFAVLSVDTAPQFGHGPH